MNESSKKIKVLVAIVTYNAEAYIKKCLDSIKSQDYEIDIIVVDNLSKDKTKAILQDYSDRIKVIYSDKNLGFGQANNLMLRYSIQKKYDYTFLLNQDTYILYQSLDKLISSALTRQEFAIYSPIHLSRNGKDMDSGFKDYIEQTRLESNSSNFTKAKFINAAAWLIPLKVLKEVGGFSPLFFHYGEDNDYAFRLNKKKGNFLIVKDAFIVHDRDSRSMAELSKVDAKKYAARFRAYLLKYAANINHSLANAFIDVFLKGIGEVKKFILKREIELALSAIGNIISIFTQMNKIVKHRDKAHKSGAFL
ncbi:MAG: glycosyltransferase [Bacteroidota bacterium]